MKILISICSLLAVVFFLFFSKDRDIAAPGPEEAMSNGAMQRNFINKPEQLPWKAIFPQPQRLFTMPIPSRQT